LEDNIIIFRHNLSRNSQFFYAVFLLLIFCSLLSLLLLKTSISIKSQGILQSAIEKAEIQIPVNGKIIAINLKDNQAIQKGDTLLKIDASLSGVKDNSIQNRMITLNHFLHDLSAITQQKPVFQIHFETPQYQTVYSQYIQDVQNAENTRQLAETTFKRYDQLFKGKVVTAAEHEKYAFDLKQATTAKQLLIQKYQSQWQTEINQYQEELRQLKEQQNEINYEQHFYTVIAPVSGSLQNLSGLQAGTYVFANQKVAEISPDTKLTAYCYIKPSDIGLIRKGQQVRLNIDAFNYNQWGFVTGKVLDISNDIIVTNNQPVFKVKCSLDQKYLQLKNGYKGFIKKGMTFNARFMVTERTLFQLLYDKVDDWVNPNLASN
jgi:HlyD family secretion protein